jgi:hypothetical protein
LPRGRSTVLNAFQVATWSLSRRISPSAGVTVAGIKRAAESWGWRGGGHGRRREGRGDGQPLADSRDADGSSHASRKDHDSGPFPASRSQILSAQSNQPNVELQFAAADESADLGDSPYVWFTIGCGESVVGAVKGKVTTRDTRSGVVHATVPNPRMHGGTQITGKCDLRVRVTDSSGIESNTLNTTVDFKN